MKFIFQTVSAAFLAVSCSSTSVDNVSLRLREQAWNSNEYIEFKQAFNIALNYHLEANKREAGQFGAMERKQYVKMRLRHDKTTDSLWSIGRNKRDAFFALYSLEAMDLTEDKFKTLISPYYKDKIGKDVEE